LAVRQHHVAYPAMGFGAAQLTGVVDVEVVVQVGGG
jgi:hypothetical protein